ncbi:hypothetical protein IHQ68_13815 [Chelatococcus sambhunathii]|uniref:Uncharacterized protein n=1 Tax=Chelatococcus sambhunathii TaxID=363953 RepID=A0ABU1DHV2_9HYPH|nr:hypothetical protein [Chelatococcus sambhunathii]MDR4307695.1 hypothetical protein [Chelatococcus sambhunathii]
MQDHEDRPSTGKDATAKPPVGQNVKDIDTPRDDAAEEADAEEGAAPAGAKSADEIEDEGSFSGRADD